jgi:hypothetical protein
MNVVGENWGIGTMNLRCARLLVMLVSLISSIGGEAGAETYDTEKVLNLITSTADRICNVVIAAGNSSGSNVKGEVKAELSGLANLTAS